MDLIEWAGVTSPSLKLEVRVEGNWKRLASSTEWGEVSLCPTGTAKLHSSLSRESLM